MFIVGVGIVERKKYFLLAGGKGGYDVREMLFEIFVGSPDEWAGEERSLTKDALALNDVDACHKATPFSRDFHDLVQLWAMHD